MFSAVAIHVFLSFQLPVCTACLEYYFRSQLSIFGPIIAPLMD